MDRPKKHRKRDMYANIPWERQNQIAEQIKQMEESNEKIILSLAFIRGMSTTDIAYWCEDNNLRSRKHNPYSRRRIQQIIAENIPDYNAYQKHTVRAQERKNHLVIAREKERTNCAMCSETENLQLHHMIPLFIGGTDAKENLIWLCKKCHDNVTAYQRETFKKQWYSPRTKKEVENES